MEIESIFEALKKSLGDRAQFVEGTGFDAVIWLDTSAVRPAMQTLKKDYEFNVLVDLTAADFSTHAKREDILRQTERRFKLVYRLMNLDPDTGLVNSRVVVACWLDGENGPPSIRDLWPNADWLEREVWDMFGVRFEDRPNIKRILLYEEFIGHPLRKDYPVTKRQPLIGPDDSIPRDRMLSGDLRPKVK